MKDYFLFESIRAKDGSVVCYHVSMIGTIEYDGVPEMKVLTGEEGEKETAFGRITLSNCSKRLSGLLRETNSRVWRTDTDIEGGSVDVISFAARDRHAKDVCEFNEGDRVLLEGRAYIRKKTLANDTRKPELSITVTGSFLIGRKKEPRRPRRNLIPQKDSLVPQSE